MTTPSSSGERLQVLGALALLLCGMGFMGFTTLGPGGPLREAWQRHQERRAIASGVANHASELAALGFRLGPGDAKHLIYEFSDYECPFCRMADSLVDRWLAAHDDAAVIYLDLPIETKHPRALAASVAAACAERQGRYAAMHQRLMRTSTWQRDGAWNREALAVGVPDTTAFQACLSNPEIEQRVRRSIALAGAFNISATPWFIAASGRFIGGAPQGDALSALP